MSAPRAPARDAWNRELLEALWGALWPQRADPVISALLMWLSDQLTWAAPEQVSRGAAPGSIPRGLSQQT